MVPLFYQKHGFDLIVQFIITNNEKVHFRSELNKNYMVEYISHESSQIFTFT